jgi:hypothetical protein
MEPGSHRHPYVDIHIATASSASFVAPNVIQSETIHVILVLDQGSPPLTRYRRLVITVTPDTARTVTR